jgi:hypothetical protein
VKRDFILALSMFVACAVVGSILGVWMVYHFNTANPPGPSDWMR